MAAGVAQLIVGEDGGVEEDDPLPPHPAKARTNGRINSNASSALALRIPNIITPRLHASKPLTG
jgi:hypothetical protein